MRAVAEHKPRVGHKVCRSKANKFPSLPSGKESDSEDYLNSGSVSTVLLDTPSLTDPEKSQSPTPVTSSPLHDEFNTNIHEEVSFFSPSHCLCMIHITNVRTDVSRKVVSWVMQFSSNVSCAFEECRESF